jgi:hypothetical protein
LTRSFQPAYSKWDTTLDNLNVIALKFRFLIVSVPQEFRHFVVHLTRYQQQYPSFTIGTLLCDSGIPELTSEKALSMQV